MLGDSATAFLSLFGQPSVAFTRSTPDQLFGTLAWSDHPSDTQEIAVDTQQPVLSPDALALIVFLRERDLVAGDRVVLAREQLRDAFLTAAGAACGTERFDTAFGELLRFRVSMIDDRSPSDSFFLHE